MHGTCVLVCMTSTRAIIYTCMIMYLRALQFKAHSPFCTAHVDDVPPWFGPNAYRAISVGLLILLAIGIVAIVGGVAFLQAQTKRKKHFF